MLFFFFTDFCTAPTPAFRTNVGLNCNVLVYACTASDRGGSSASAAMASRADAVEDEEDDVEDVRVFLFCKSGRNKLGSARRDSGSLFLFLLPALALSSSAAEVGAARRARAAVALPAHEREGGGPVRPADRGQTADLSAFPGQSIR